MNSTPSKFLTTLRGTVTASTTPESSAANPQTAPSVINTLQTTWPPAPTSTAEPTASTVTIANSIGTTTAQQPQPSAHRIPSRLEEKLESLSCDIPPLPTESRLWRGNETHELMLPITVSKPKLEPESDGPSKSVLLLCVFSVANCTQYFSALAIRGARTRGHAVRFSNPNESTLQMLNPITNGIPDTVCM